MRTLNDYIFSGRSLLQVAAETHMRIAQLGMTEDGMRALEAQGLFSEGKKCNRCEWVCTYKWGLRDGFCRECKPSLFFP